MTKQDPRTIVNTDEDHTFNPPISKKVVDRTLDDKFKLIWKVDKVDTRDYKYQLSSVLNPNFVDLRSHCSPIENQGTLSLFNTDAQSFTLDKYGGGGARTYTFPTNTLQVNKWQYIILNRNASTQVETMWVGTFVNTSSYVTCSRATGATGGSSIIDGTQVNNLDYTGICNWIGQFYGGYWPGFITNLRVTVGTAVYDSTSSTIRAPSAPLTNLANTKYLMLGAVVTTDTSATQTVTNNNTVTQNILKPF
jgi:hypothetical protein